MVFFLYCSSMTMGSVVRVTIETRRLKACASSFSHHRALAQAWTFKQVAPSSAINRVAIAVNDFSLSHTESVKA